jgi:hypothetical protein
VLIPSSCQPGLELISKLRFTYSNARNMVAVEFA